MFLADDIVAGGVRYFVNGKISLQKEIRQRVANTLFIWKGLFEGTALQIISRFTWEIIQTASGFFAAHAANLFLPVAAVKYFHGCTVLEGGGVGGSLCLGSFILLYPREKLDGPVCRHEYGHALQSRISGPLYYFKYGISSLLANRASWAETDANYRAALYFGEFPFPGGKKASEPVNPKCWEYVLFFAGVGIILIPVLNYREGR